MYIIKYIGEFDSYTVWLIGSFILYFIFVIIIDLLVFFENYTILLFCGYIYDVIIYIYLFI